MPKMHKIGNLLLALVTPFLICSSFASGVMTISGKLTSITDTLYLVETRQSVYYIQKKAVSPAVAATIKQTEVPVTLTVPIEAISVVKSKVVSSR